MQEGPAALLLKLLQQLVNLVLHVLRVLDLEPEESRPEPPAPNRQPHPAPAWCRPCVCGAGPRGARQGRDTERLQQGGWPQMPHIRALQTLAACTAPTLKMSRPDPDSTVAGPVSQRGSPGAVPCTVVGQAAPVAPTRQLPLASLPAVRPTVCAVRCPLVENHRPGRRRPCQGTAPGWSGASSSARLSWQGLACGRGPSLPPVSACEQCLSSASSRQPDPSGCHVCYFWDVSAPSALSFA